MKKIVISSALLLTPMLALAQPPAGKPASMSDAFMMQLDNNKDGKVSKAEFLAPHEKQFADIDANKDGNIDRGEIEALEKKMRERMQQMRQQQQQTPEKR